MQAKKRLAVITGATSGIGRSFALALAKQGYNLWLIGRRKELLNALSLELNKDYGIEAEVIICDLGDLIELSDLALRLSKALDLEILINNAGYSVDGQFHDTSYNEHEKQINVHMIAATKLCYLALPLMCANKKGAIINVCSVASFIPTPFSPLYGPTKAYLKSISETLAIAYKDQGIRIQALCPGFTVTDFHTRIGIDPKDVYFKKGPLRSYSADEVVAHSLEDLRLGKVISIPGANYRFLVTLLRILPFKWLYKILDQRKKIPRYTAAVKK